MVLFVKDWLLFEFFFNNLNLEKIVFNFTYQVKNELFSSFEKQFFWCKDKFRKIDVLLKM